MVQVSVLSVTAMSEPGTPAEGATYSLAVDTSWAGRFGQLERTLARCIDGARIFIAPGEGCQVFDLAAGCLPV